MLSARPDLKKYTSLYFHQAVKRHADAIGPGEDGVMVVMKALGLEPLLTLVCSDIHQEMEGYPVQKRAENVIPLLPSVARGSATGFG